MGNINIGIMKNRLPLQEQNPHNAYTAIVDKPIWKGCLTLFLFFFIVFGIGIFLIFGLTK